MKMETATAPTAIESVTPPNANILQSMKNQFLQDTTKLAEVEDSQISVDSVPQPRQNPLASKKTKPVDKSISVIVAKSKGGRPKVKKSAQKGLFKGGAVVKAKENNSKFLNSGSPVTNNGVSMKDDLITNSFAKLATKGLRDIRKPDGIDQQSSEESLKDASSVKGRGVSPAVSRGVPAARKVSLLSMIAAGPLSKNGKPKVAPKARQVASVKKKFAIAAKTKQATTKKNVEMSTKQTLDINTDESDGIAVKRPHSTKTNKRKNTNDDLSMSPRAKCSKKTTIVAEVHQSMHGETQPTPLSSSRTNSLSKKKIKDVSPGSIDVLSPKSATESPSSTKSSTEDAALNVSCKASGDSEKAHTNLPVTPPKTPESPLKDTPSNILSVSSTVINGLDDAKVNMDNGDDSCLIDDSKKLSTDSRDSESVHLRLSPSPQKISSSSNTDSTSVEDTDAQIIPTGTEKASPCNGNILKSSTVVNCLVDKSPSRPKRKISTPLKLLDSSIQETSKNIKTSTVEEQRTKSPTGSDCDNNNSEGLKCKTSKPVKRPRYLKNLFRDEGVQNMLKDIEDSPQTTALEGDVQPLKTARAAKLRPKRPADLSMAETDSDVEFTAVVPSKKKKRSSIEVDSASNDKHGSQTKVNAATLCKSYINSLSVLNGDITLTPVSQIKIEKDDLTTGNRKKGGRPPKSNKSFDDSSQYPVIDLESEEISKPSKKFCGPPSMEGRLTFFNNHDSVAKPSPEIVAAKRPSDVSRDSSILSKPGKSPTRPVHIPRAELPSSPTVASLTSLVRSLERKEGAEAVPPSDVAFLPNGVPGPIIPVRSARNIISTGGSMVRQSQRACARNTGSDGGHNYRDIVLRKMHNFLHITMTPQTTKMKNSFNSRILRELCLALNSVRSDPSVRLVLVTSNGHWSQGVDLPSLHHHNAEQRHNRAHNLATAIKEISKLLVSFPKPVIAGVTGRAVGLGVTLLPLFDMVFASDGAELWLPYGKIGQVPEGGATYTFPNLLGKLQAGRLFMGHKLTASEAMGLGLVSEVLFKASFVETLLPKVALLATQNAQFMEATKALTSGSLLPRVALAVDAEGAALVRQWTQPQWDLLSKAFLESQRPCMQRPVPVSL